MEEFMNENYEFRYNVITCRPEFRKKTENDGNNQSFQLVDDYSFNSVRREIKNNHIRTSTAELKSLLNSDFVPQFHPFRDYLENLGEWDGMDYIQELADSIKATNQTYLHFVFKK